MNLACRWTALAGAAAILLVTTGCVSAPRERAPDRGTVQQRDEPPLTRAERLLDANRLYEAEATLAEIDSSTLSARDRHRLRVLRAELSLAAQQPLSALRDLPAPRATPDRELAARTEAVRAETLLAIGDVAGAVSALVTRGELLDDPATHATNADRIWELLANQPLDAGAQSRFSGADRVTRGWFELALIARGAVPGERVELLERWRSRFPNHPASAGRAMNFRARRVGEDWIKTESGGDIAVLLPEQGRFAAIGGSVRDGLVTAWQERPEPRPKLRFYDSGEAPEDVLRAVDRALDDGATLILGPLRKTHVNALARYGAPPVPILTFNQMDPELLPPRNIIQYGLAPEDEARAAVRRATAEGSGRMLALLMQAEWTDRILGSLERAVDELGGQLLEVQFLAEGGDLSAPVKAMLNVDASEARHRAVTRALGLRPEFDASARADAQSIFFIARQREAQQIAPRFAYFRAGDLPVYTTALAWEGVTPVPEEIRGLRICDMPWMMQNPDARWMPLREALAEDAERRFERFPRLFALGHDALLMALQFQQGWAPGEAFPGATGYLQLTREGHVRRELGCATLQAEGAIPLPPITSQESAPLEMREGLPRSIDDDSGDERWRDDFRSRDD